jgi:hypothetical protein
MKVISGGRREALLINVPSSRIGIADYQSVRLSVGGTVLIFKKALLNVFFFMKMAFDSRKGLADRSACKQN